MLLTAVVILLCVVAGALTWAVYQLLLQNGKVQLRVEGLENRLRAQGVIGDSSAPVSSGLPRGSLLPDFELPALAGGTRRLTDWRGQSLLLIFFNPSCTFCREMLPDLAFLPAGGNGIPTPVIISAGDERQNREMFAAHGVSHPVLLQRDGEVSELYWVNATPSAYLVSEEGLVASVLHTGADAVLAAARRGAPPSLLPRSASPRRQFSRSLADSRIVREGLKAGTPAPPFTLPLATGGEISLAAYGRRRVLLVFSDPDCGPCASLAPRLEQLQSSLELDILMISRGDPETNRRRIAEHGITFPVALQRHWEISRAYGIFATPVGFWIGEDGRLAADVAVGAEAVLKMASKARSRAKRQAIPATR